MDANDAAKQLYNYTLKEVKAIDSNAIFSDDAPFFKEAFFNKSKDNTPLNISITSHLDKKEEKILVFCSPNPAPEETFSLGKFSNLAQNVVDLGFWEVDLVQNKVYWSDRVYALHETTTEEYTPTLETAINFYREDYRELVAKSVQNLIDTGKDYTFEAVIITSKKNEKWIRATGTAEYKNGEPIKIYGSIVDIDPFKSTEKRYKNLTNNLPGVAYQFILKPDGETQVTHVSSGAENILGYSKDEAQENLTEIWGRIRMGGDYDYLLDTIYVSKQHLSFWNATWRYVHPDGKLKTLRGYGTPTKLVNGDIVFHSLIIDVTEETKAKELLQQATDVAKIGSWEFDLLTSKKGALYCDANTEKILETKQEKIPLNESFINFTSKEKATSFLQIVTELIKHDIPFDEEFLIKTPSNKNKWIRVSGVGERANNRCLKIYGSIQDITKSKNLEDQIKDILTSINDAFYALDEEQCFTYVNEAALKLLNKTEEELLGNNIWDLYPQKIFKNIRKEYEYVLKTGNNTKFEFLDRSDGTWYEIYVYKAAQGLSAYYRDISQRKLALENLEKSVSDKNAILESIGDAFFTLNKNWEITYWNKKAESFTGYHYKDVLGMYFWDLYKQDVDTKFHKQFVKAMESEQNVFFEDYNLNRKKWFDFRLYGSKNGISAYISDITIKKKTNILLKEANQLFEKVTQATNDAIWEWDINLNKVRRSKQFVDKFGEDLNPFFCKPNSWKFMLSPEKYTNLQNKVKEVLKDKGQNKWELEYTISNAEKHVTNILERGIIERDNTGKPIKLVGAITDITNQKKLEKDLLKLNSELQLYSKKLEKSNKELEQFAFVTSHDLQEPLRMISSFLDLFQKKYGDQLDSKGKKYIFYATDAAKRMKTIIVDLLKYSRVTNVDGPKEDVDLNKIIQDFKTLRAKRIEDTAASIVSDNLPVVHGYTALLTQIFHALLDNALKYAKQDFPPLIDVLVEDKDTEWLFTIKDNGIGIAPEFHEKIFLLFQRLHNKDSYSGTGIGLTYVKRSVEFLGGKIWLESEENEGTSFYFTLKKESVDK